MITAFITEVVSDVTTFLFTLVGMEKEAFKVLLEQWHLIHFWNVTRDQFVILPVIVGLPAGLLVERVFGRMRRRTFSPAFWQGVWFRVLNALLLSTFLASALRAVHIGYDVYLPFLQLRILDGAALWLQFIVFFVAGDFLRYCHHWIRHKIPLMWAFHAVHHSDSEVNPGTSLREHISDPIAASLLSAGPIMILGGDPSVTFVFTIAHRFWVNLTHASTPITFGLLGKVVVSPAYHRIHHSAERRHVDKNFGEVLTIWDRMFGTACFDFQDDYECGVAGYDGANPNSGSLRAYLTTWAWLTVRPFLDIARGGWRSRSPAVYKR